MDVHARGLAISQLAAVRHASHKGTIATGDAPSVTSRTLFEFGAESRDLYLGVL